MIDKVDELTFEKNVKGYKNITKNEMMLNGYLHGKSFFPNTLVVESLAQLGGLLFIKMERDIRNLGCELVYLCGINNAEFIGHAVPGDKLELECTLKHKFGNLLKVSGTARVGDKLICSTEITFVKDKR